MSVLERVLQSFSGNTTYEMSKQLVFQKVIGVRGLSGGVGTSTIVQNLAYYYSKKKNMRVCVIDTSFLNPTQVVMLGASKSPLDLLDYRGGVEKISDYIAPTKMKKVSLVSMQDRTILDMVDKDEAAGVLKMLHALKMYFDIIIIDLANEPTNVVTNLALKCNKIITIADQSAKCVYHAKETLNRFATLAVPLEKMKYCILNKVVEGVKTTTVHSLEEAGLQVVGQIPLNKEIAHLGITGNVVMSFSGETQGFFIFEETIQMLAESLLPRTPVNSEHHTEEYTGELVQESKKVKAKKKLKNKKQTDEPLIGNTSIQQQQVEVPKVVSDLETLEVEDISTIVELEEIPPVAPTYVQSNIETQQSVHIPQTSVMQGLNKLANQVPNANHIANEGPIPNVGGVPSTTILPEVNKPTTSNTSTQGTAQEFKLF